MRWLQWCIATSSFCNAPFLCHAHNRSGRNNQPLECGREGNLVMIFDNIVSRARTSMAKRRQYNRLIAEIDSLSSRDLADVRAAGGKIIYQIHKPISG